MKIRFLAIIVIVQLVALSQAAVPVPAPLSTNLHHEGRVAITRGMAWLESQQGTNGCIGSPEYPAITALAYRALKDGGSTNAAVLARIEKYLGRYLAGTPAGWMNEYNVAICQGVLSSNAPFTTNNTQLSWIAKRKQLDREYDIKAREFELRQREWQQERSVLLAKGVDADLERASRIAKGIVGCEQLAASSEQLAASSGKGTGTVSSGPSAVGRSQRSSRRRGYGSLTYEGRMRLIHDEVTCDDPRVDAYLDWAERSWSLEGNPGAGARGVYYFYHSLAKCLAASGEEEIFPLAGGASIKWREELIRKLVSLQHTDAANRTAYWVNDSGVWMEDNPVLVTAYAVLALERSVGGGQ